MEDKTRKITNLSRVVQLFIKITIMLEMNVTENIFFWVQNVRLKLFKNQKVEKEECVLC